jgi:hypothetical protein
MQLLQPKYKLQEDAVHKQNKGLFSFPKLFFYITFGSGEDF